VHIWNLRLALLLTPLLLGLAPRTGRAADTLLTVAEKSGFQATSHHAEVVDFCQQLARQSAVVRLGELGVSHEGRKLPLVILADPPVSTPAEAAQSGKLIVYAQGNIHAGEVDGKEGLLMLARELATGSARSLLKDLIVVIAPIFNADGNEKFAPNRRHQGGPEEVGVRANAQGLDLNRDFVKLESPEVRALVQFLNRWDPAVFIDAHTTNGSYHRFTMTYEGQRHPACDPRLVALVNDELLPDVTRRLEQRSGYKSYFYGNFTRDRAGWETVPATPRYGIHYVGLRNRIAILSESYAYASFRDRVLASRDFVHSILDYVAENKDKVRTALAEAREATVQAGRAPDPAAALAVRHRSVPRPGPGVVLGFVEEQKDGRAVPTAQTRDYPVEYLGGCEPTLTVTRPYAYLFPASQTRAVEVLQRHGVEVEELREDIEVEVEAYRVDKVSRERSFQNHQLASIEVSPHGGPRRLEAGTVLVRTGQPLGTLASYLLEPMSEDGLVTWNFFDDAIREGQDFPVLRLAAAVPVRAGRVRPLPEDRSMGRIVTTELLRELGARAQFGGLSPQAVHWLEDGEHYLETRSDGREYLVHAQTGMLRLAKPAADDARMTKALADLPPVGPEAAKELARRARANVDPKRTGAFVEHGEDLYYVRLDGSKAARLTHAPGRKELPSFSPDGRFIAFVRANNLYVVDVDTQTVRALTTDGTDLVSNGKADWVYFEEIFDRNWKAYWWSPDSLRVAFLRFDDRPVHKFTVLDPIPVRQVVEATPYPKAGDPNPVVKLGLVAVSGGPAVFPDLGNYSENSSLVIRSGWTPDGKQAYFYVQDRAQTWLDFCMVPAAGGKPTRLFRETTRAFVEDLGAPVFLKDGSFLVLSERTGWKHVYHFEKDGKMRRPVTSGDWEARRIERVDEDQGWVYLSGTKDSPTTSNAYRVKLDGSALEKVTERAGDHAVSFGPRGDFFIDAWSDATSPPQTRLCRTDGTTVRTLDNNPAYELEEFKFGTYERAQIKTPDGFELEAAITRPADFDPQKRYPVWFTTYGGPHAPTIHDGGGRGRGMGDQALANQGYVVFRADPRSASGKGAVSTWAAYRQLGVQELKDVETAIQWLIENHPYVDASRIGMSGYSYGGFLTAYCLTHSKLFAAGIAGAPVTDWHNYDSIYTERYMNTPQENPDGYRVASVVKAADQVHGKLLLLHGVMDDNVHLQNSVQLADALQKAGKDFEMMFYAHSRHGIGGPYGRHYKRLTDEFMKRELRPKEAAGGNAEPGLKGQG
jgi:dipeptidyl aminopeptidase/acylaminoacyl peptidase